MDRQEHDIPSRSRPGRPPERIRLDAEAQAQAKLLLADAESVLDASANAVARSLGVTAKTWRSYKDVSDPGPTPEKVRALAELARLRGADDFAHRLVQVWLGESLSEGSQDGMLAEAPSVPTRRRGKSLLVFGCVVAALAIGVTAAVLTSRNSEAGGVEILLYNKVVFDETSMSEDTPAYLTISPECLAWSTCGVEGTDRLVTGDSVTAVCQTKGAFVTNRLGDTPNPESYDSTLWYGVELDGAFGYLSEVWISAGDRGGLGLRACDPTG